MALPPTLIYRYISSPERTRENLRKAGLLDDPDHKLVDAVKNARKSYGDNVQDGMVGPNENDITAHALQPYLNKTGQYLAQTPEFGLTKKEKVHIMFLRMRAKMSRFWN